MKKKAWLAWICVFLVSIAACGKTEKPVTSTPEADTAAVETIELQLEYNEAAQVKGIIRAFSADGSLVWEYVTDDCDVGQCDVIEEIGLGAAGYIFLENGSVCCLDPATGEVLWINEEFGGTSAYWSFDDADNLYLTGYFAPWLFCVDPQGQTLVDYEDMPAEYNEQGFYWPASMSIDSDGMVHIRYFSNDQIMVIDPATGEVLDVYWYTDALDPAILTGEWVDDLANPTVKLIVCNNLKFEAFLHVDNETSYHYEGRFNLDTLSEKYSPGPDWLRSELISTDDPDIEKIGNVGDFIVIFTSSQEETVDCIFLTQINNGDSMLSMHLGVFGVTLYRVL